MQQEGTKLYLDTARLGLPSEYTKGAIASLSLLSSEEGLSLRFEELLRGGFDSWGAGLKSRYSNLSSWGGIESLKRSFRKSIGSPDESPVFLASRSAELMRLAARILFRLCRRVLVTDLSWPGYAQILFEESRRTRGKVVEIAIRRAVLGENFSAREVARKISTTYKTERCDSFFLPAVSHDGIHLPVRKIYNAVSILEPPKFVILDCAQAFSHVPIADEVAVSDFVILGCHKWLAAHHPLGVAVAPRNRTNYFVEESVRRLLCGRDIDDPLLRFTSELETGSTDRFSETVNVAPLFSAQAALVGDRFHLSRESFRSKRANAMTLSELAAAAGWHSVVPSADFRSAIILLRAKGRSQIACSPEQLRWQFQNSGVSLTACSGGVIRVSVPGRPLGPRGRELFSRALESSAAVL